MGELTRSYELSRTDEGVDGGAQDECPTVVGSEDLARTKCDSRREAGYAPRSLVTNRGTLRHLGLVPGGLLTALLTLESSVVNVDLDIDNIPQFVGFLLRCCLCLSRYSSHVLCRLQVS